MPKIGKDFQTLIELFKVGGGINEMVLEVLMS